VEKVKVKIEWKKKRGKHICMLCGGCVASCPNQALSFNKSREDLTFDDEIIHDPSKCSGCGICVEFCPERMLKLKN